LATRATVSDEEIQLRKRARRRLVGAIALVVAVVAAVPMLLDSEPKARTQQIEIQMPPPTAEASSAQTDAQAAAPAPPATATPAPALQPAPPPVAERAPAPQPAPPESVPPPAPATPPAPAPKAAAAATKESYVVQLIATTSPVKARELRQKLERQKFPAYTEKTPDGGKTRVRVGPFDTREAAEQARQRLAKLDYDPGKVVRRGD
jgi:DedD protein